MVARELRRSLDIVGERLVVGLELRAFAGELGASLGDRREVGGRSAYGASKAGDGRCVAAVALGVSDGLAGSEGLTLRCICCGGRALADGGEFGFECFENAEAVQELGVDEFGESAGGLGRGLACGLVATDLLDERLDALLEVFEELHAWCERGDLRGGRLVGGARVLQERGASLAEFLEAIADDLPELLSTGRASC